MVGIVTGLGLGLERSSAFVLGSRGQIGNAQLGRNGERIYVNAATGNLMINRTDEILMGQGPDDDLIRSYNSLGDHSDENGDNWLLNANRHVGTATGTVNTTGSTVIRYDWDGSDTVYTYDDARGLYVAKDGPGSYDTLKYTTNNGGTWTWTDGDTRIVDVYDASHSGRIKTSTDLDGNTLTFGYDPTSGLLTTVTTTVNGTGSTPEVTTLVYDTGNKLQRIDVSLNGGVTVTRTSYNYDASGRLKKVTTDLTPDVATDSNVFTTLYEYDATSNFVSKITQSDGAKIEFTYQLVSGTYRVHTVKQTTDTAGNYSLTTIDYDPANLVTTITDQQGNVTKLTYNNNKSLRKVELGVVGGAATETYRYTYNASGDVESFRDGANNATIYSYDDNGNLTKKVDALGNTCVYTYGSKNELLTETHFAVPDTAATQDLVHDKPMTTRYAYDSDNHLRFMISAEGEVTEYQYYGNNSANGDGNGKTVMVYRNAVKSLAGLGYTDPLLESDMATWASANRDSTIERTNYTYDLRGNISVVTEFGACDSSGTGLTSQPYRRTTYVYDYNGNLKSQHVTGSDTESWDYDGLGRVISHTLLNGSTTTTEFADASDQVIVRLTNGRVETSTYDLAGRLINYAVAGADPSPTQTKYTYDGAGRLVSVEDPLHNKSFFVYDILGRKIADIGADGSVTEYAYNTRDDVTYSVRYAKTIDTSGLVAGSIDLNTVRPALSTGHDVWNWRVYDAANRLIETVDGEGSVVDYDYDGASRLVKTTAFAAQIDVSGFVNTALTARQTVGPTADDRVTRSFYDDDGRLVGTLDGLGYFARTKYDGAGEKTETIAYFNKINASLRATGSFDDIIASITASDYDQHNYYFYDGRGLLIYTVDNTLHATAYVRDGAGNVTNTIRYAGQLSLGTGLTYAGVQSQLQGSMAGDPDNRSSYAIYDDANRLIYSVDAGRAVTKYTYDTLDQVVRQLTFANTTDVSVVNMTNLNTWADAAAQTTDTDNRAIWYFRDDKGRVVYEAYAAGYVTKYLYDADDHVTTKIAYAAKYAIDDSTTWDDLNALPDDPPPSTAVVTGYSYDPFGRVSDVFDGRNVSTHFDYDGTGKLVARFEANNTALKAKTAYTYDAAGNLETETDPANLKTTYSYNAFHQVAAKVVTGTVSGVAASTETRYSFDVGGRMVDEIDSFDVAADKTRTHYEYSALGVVDRTDAADDTTYMSITHYDYDTQGRLSAETKGSNGAAGEQSRTTYGYNAFGEVTERWDGANDNTLRSQTTSTYYTTGKLKSQTRAANGLAVERSTTSYTYTAFGEILEITQAASTTVATVTHRDYDLMGRMVTEYHAYASTPDDQTKTTFAYDAFGHVVDKFEGVGSAESRTHYEYDLAGRLWKEWHAYLANGQTEILYGYDDLNRLTDKTVAANIPADASRTHYDYYGVTTRVSYETRAADVSVDTSVTKYVYDGLGRLLERTDGYNDSSISTVTRYAYDGMSRVAYEYRGYGQSDPKQKTTTQFLYDHLGQLADKTVAFGTDDAVRAHYKYDKAGRLLEQTDDADGDPIVTRFVYDALNRVTDRYDASGTTDAAHTHYTYDRSSRLTQQNDADGITITNFYYDALGEVTRKEVGDTSDPDLIATDFAYDHRGNLILVTRKIINAVTKTAYQYDARDNVILTTTDVGGLSEAKTYSFYDALDRKIYEVDAENFVTKTAYNGRGEVKAVTRYFARATVTGIVAGNLGSFTVNMTAGEDATTEFEIDNLGRVTATTDAMTVAEHYTYNVLGQRTSVTNRLGGTTTYSYDHLGRLVLERAHVATLHYGESVPTEEDIDTTYEYDLRGNRTKMVEGSGLRTTTYQYDGRDRLTLTSHDVADYRDDSFVLRSFTPTEKLTYDRRGNVIQSEDAAGARTVYYYDDANRKIAQIDAKAGLTRWTYYSSGNIATVRSYDTALSGGIPDPLVVLVPPDGNLNDTYRETGYTYDGLNRLLTTTVADVYTGRFSGGHYVIDADKNIAVTTQYWGGTNNVWRQTDGVGFNVYFWYDKLGRKVAQLDQERYLTTYAYDADGNVTTETRFAKSFDGTISSSVVPTVDSTPDQDRVTTFAYDRNGRRTTETRLGVAYVQLTTLLDENAHAPVTYTDSSIVRYEYNALGEVTKKTEATGDYTKYTYDTQGRQTVVEKSSYTGFGDTAAGTFTPVTNQYYDALGDLTQTTELGAVNRVTSYHYLNGRMDYMDDARGNRTYYYYDKAGRTVLTTYKRKDSDLTTLHDEGNAQKFDELGRVVWQSVVKLQDNSWNHPGDYVQTFYNTHGDVIERRVNDVVEETNVYDKAGRLIRSNAGDGVVKLYINDANGNQTAVITSSGDDPANFSWASVTAETAAALLTDETGTYLDTGAETGLAVTINIYYARNLKYSTWQTLRELDATHTMTLKTYTLRNAFGEVSEEKDAYLRSTLYTYNTLGKMLTRTDTATDYTDATGTLHADANAVTKYGYDISGRLIAVTDANNHALTRELLKNTGYGGEEASVTVEYHADGGTYQRFYDAFGDLRRTVNEIGTEERLGYDAMSNLTSVKHNYGNAAMDLLDTYVYDSLGQRVQHYNDLPGYGAAAIEKTDYDAQGRVWKTTDMAGYVTEYTYEWNALLDAGLGTKGGWIKTTKGPAVNAGTSRQTIEKTDYYGRTTSSTDYGNHTYTYTYDDAGRLHLRHTTGEDVTLTYFNTGALASQLSVMGGVTKSTTTYGYDRNGNRTRETMVDGSSHTLQDMTVTYDEMNRMLSLNNNVNISYADGIHIDWTYDQVGNIRRTDTTYYLPKDTTGALDGTDEQEKDYWYKYDAMNRVTVSKGQLYGNAIVRGTTDTENGNNIVSDGMSITYDDAGNRASVITSKVVKDSYEDGGAGGWHWTYTVDDVTESYTYDGGYLKTVHLADSAGQTMQSYDVAEYTRDAMGRVTDYKEYDSADKVHGITYRRQADYNKISQVTSDEVDVYHHGGDHNHSVTTYTYTDANGYYQGGSVMKTVATNDTTHNDGDNDVYGNSITTNTYEWWSQAEMHETVYDPDNMHENEARDSKYFYDGGGNLTEVQIVDGYSRNVWFTNDADGHIVKRFEDNTSSTRGDPTEYRFFFNGIQVGAVGNNGTTNEDYAASAAEHTATGTGPFRGGRSSSIDYADFDQSYDAINGLTYQAAPQQYTVQGGDSLQSIAETLWGDSSFWYLIADANGLNGSESLTGGMSLILPNKVHNIHNNADTFRPYDPNTAEGALFPGMAKPAKHGANCGIFGQILLVVVAAVVAYFTAGAALHALFGLSSFAEASIGEAVVAGAIGGAAGSVASQTVGLATGMQTSFNWGAVGMAAIGGAVGAGLGPNTLTGVNGAFSSMPGITGAIARGVTGNVITQGVGVATGLQKSFDWAGVAAAGVMAGVTAYASKNLPGAAVHAGDPFGNGRTAYFDHAASGFNRALSGMAGLIAGAAARSLINGTDFGDNITAMLPDAVGQTIGSIITDSFVHSPIQDAKDAIDEYRASLPPLEASAVSAVQLADATGATTIDDGQAGGATSKADGDPKYLKFLRDNFPKILDPETEYRALQQRHVSSFMNDDKTKVFVNENTRGKPFLDGEDISKAVPTEVNFDAFYKALYTDLGGGNPNPAPAQNDAKALVKILFDNEVPIIPETGKPLFVKDIAYNSTFYAMGKVDYHGQDINSHDVYGEINAIFFNPEAGIHTANDHGVPDSPHISPALALIHEVDHAVGYILSPLGEYALHYSNIPTSGPYTKYLPYSNLEEIRVESGAKERDGGGLTIDEANAIMKFNKMKPDTIEAADKLLSDMRGFALENRVAQVLGEPIRQNHLGSFILVKDPTDFSIK